MTAFLILAVWSVVSVPTAWLVGRCAGIADKREARDAARERHPSRHGLRFTERGALIDERQARDEAQRRYAPMASGEKEFWL